MNKFLFKSNNSDLQKIYSVNFNLILTEQRAQRHDLFVLTKMLRELINSTNLQKQVDEYFVDSGEAHPEPDEDTEHIPEVENDSTESSN